MNKAYCKKCEHGSGFCYCEFVNEFTGEAEWPIILKSERNKTGECKNHKPVVEPKKDVKEPLTTITGHGRKAMIKTVALVSKLNHINQIIDNGSNDTIKTKPYLLPIVDPYLGFWFNFSAIIFIIIVIIATSIYIISIFTK